MAQVTLTTDLGSDLLETLGRITVGFGQVEYCLMLASKRLDPSVSYFEGMEQAQKLRTIDKLCQRASELYGILKIEQAQETEFDAMLQDPKGLWERRHAVVHALWGRRSDTGEVVWWRHSK